MDGNGKTPPTPPGNLGPLATTEPGFPYFFSTTVPGIFSLLNIVFIYHPHGFFVNRGGEYETNINSQVYSFDILIQKQCDCEHCILYLGYVLGLQYMPEKTPTCTTDSSLLTSLPPLTDEIVIGKIPHTVEESQLKPTTPFGKKRSPSMGGARIFAGTALNRPKIQQKQYPMAGVIDEEDTLKYSNWLKF